MTETPGAPLLSLPPPLNPQVAIIGRPNVGKSALFNRLVGRRAALVRDTPGGHVTRDVREGRARLADLSFLALDTSGLEPTELLRGGSKSSGGGGGGESIQARTAALTARALLRTDVALLLLDGRTGLLPGDEELGRWLRAAGLPCAVVLAANKCERRGPGGEAGVAAAMAETVRLGFGEAVAVSAETGEGMAELYAALQPGVDAAVAARRAMAGLPPAEAGEAGALEAVDPAAQGPLRVAIVGLPNVVRGGGREGGQEAGARVRGTGKAGQLWRVDTPALQARPPVATPPGPTPLVYCPPPPHPPGQVDAGQLAAGGGAEPDGARAGADARRGAGAARARGARR